MTPYKKICVICLLLCCVVAVFCVSPCAMELHRPLDATNKTHFRPIRKFRFPLETKNILISNYTTNVNFFGIRTYKGIENILFNRFEGNQSLLMPSRANRCKSIVFFGMFNIFHVWLSCKFFNSCEKVVFHFVCWCFSSVFENWHEGKDVIISRCFKFVRFVAININKNIGSKFYFVSVSGRILPIFLFL